MILGIAWINYINLTTARSLTRAREVGIRKVSGATRLQLVYQFLGEAIMINILSVAIAMVLVYLLAASFYELMGFSSMNVGVITSASWEMAGMLATIFLIGICLTGFYPAKILSSYNPALVMKGKLGAGKGLSLRKALVAFQFTTSIGLTIAVLTFNQQFQFMQSQDLGIDIRKTMIVRAPADVDSTYLIKLASLKNQLQRISIVSSITSSSSVPGENVGWLGVIRKIKGEPQRPGFSINIVDQDFIESYHLTLLAGRNFDPSDFPILKHFGSKIEPVIVNREAMNQLGYRNADESIGTKIYWNDNECRIVGVIDDFHQQSLKNSIRPIIFTANTGPMLSLKLTNAVNDGNLAGSIRTIHTHWDSVFPENAFDYFFLEDFYSRQYADDKQVANLFTVFCWLAIIISGLGLFGLSSFTVSQRTREVSIRKVLGATSASLVKLLTKDSILLIIIAAVVALPISYLGIEQWLQGFAFHIDLSIFYFLAPVVMILFIAFLTISFQTYKVITSDPVETLKHE